MNNILDNINQLFNLYKTVALTTEEKITQQMLKDLTPENNDILKGKDAKYSTEYFEHLANYLNQTKSQGEVNSINFDNFLLYIRQLINTEKASENLDSIKNDLIDIKLSNNEEINKINTKIENVKNSNLSFDEKTDIINDLKEKKKTLEEKQLQKSDDKITKEQEESKKKEQEENEKKETQIKKINEDNQKKIDSVTTRREKKHIKKTEAEISRLEKREKWLTNRKNSLVKSFPPRKVSKWIKHSLSYVFVLPALNDLVKLSLIGYDKIISIPGKHNKRARLEAKLQEFTAEINKRAGIIENPEEYVNAKYKKEEENLYKKQEKTKSKEQTIEELKKYREQVVKGNYKPMADKEIKNAQNNIGEYKPRGR